jgi:hypothetical protein
VTADWRKYCRKLKIGRAAKPSVGRQICLVLFNSLNENKGGWLVGSYTVKGLSSGCQHRTSAATRGRPGVRTGQRQARDVLAWPVGLRKQTVAAVKGKAIR